VDRNYDKGIDLLIEAAGLLKAQGRTDFVLDIYGRVTDGGFAERVHALGLTGCVAFKGMLDQDALLEAYADYDLFAFPGRVDEPFGFAPLEAMARGCVPVIGRRCGLGEWLVHGVHCLKVARYAESFADAFRRILDGEVALHPLARRAEAAVWRDFHLDALLPRIEAALADATARPRGLAGEPDDAYRLALLAEKLSEVLIHETCVA
jgi:glycosyltransferase involved in cell wall biosynthesis